MRAKGISKSQSKLSQRRVRLPYKRYHVRSFLEAVDVTIISWLLSSLPTDVGTRNWSKHTPPIVFILSSQSTTNYVPIWTTVGNDLQIKILISLSALCHIKMSTTINCFCS